MAKKRKYVPHGRKPAIGQAMERYETRQQLIALGLWDEFDKIHWRLRLAKGRSNNYAWNTALLHTVARYAKREGKYSDYEFYVDTIKKLRPGIRNLKARMEASRCMLRMAKGSYPEVIEQNQAKKLQDKQKAAMRKNLQEAGRLEAFKPLVNHYVAGGMLHFDACLKAYHELMAGKQGRKVVWE